MDSDDQIEQQIQAHYEKFQQDRLNPKHSLAIADLYEQRKEYANAVPWIQCAFEQGGSVDHALEDRILDLQIFALKQELTGLQGHEGAVLKYEPESLPELKAAVDKKLGELNKLLKVRKQRGER